VYNVRERRPLRCKAAEALSLIQVKTKKGWFTVENEQVTIAIQALGLKGRLGRPILILCEALESPPQQFVWLRGTPSGTFEVGRRAVPDGPLMAAEVAIIQAHTVQELYTSLLFWKGIQAELEAST